MAIYYSGKSFGPKYLFADMLSAWGISKLALVRENWGLHLYVRVQNGGGEKKSPRGGGGLASRHNGDALIITHYDGCSKPSEVRIASITLWVRFYDLPLKMMKEVFAKQLGGQLGKLSRWTLGILNTCMSVWSSLFIEHWWQRLK
jgi:hypothetical protein